MKLLDNYLFSISNNSTDLVEVDKNQIINDHKQYGYDNDTEIELDFDILLKMKYQNIKELGKTEIKKKRTKQEKFREDLIKRYNGKCVVSGSSCLREIDAAHIKPVNEDGEYVIDNGLLLKKDIHSTFDDYLWSINPETLQIECKDENIGEIKKYEGKKLNISTNIKLVKYLQFHYNKFVS